MGRYEWVVEDEGRRRKGEGDGWAASGGRSWPGSRRGGRTLGHRWAKAKDEGRSRRKSPVSVQVRQAHNGGGTRSARTPLQFLARSGWYRASHSIIATLHSCPTTPYVSFPDRALPRLEPRSRRRWSASRRFCPKLAQHRRPKPEQSARHHDAGPLWHLRLPHTLSPSSFYNPQQQQHHHSTTTTTTLPDSTMSAAPSSSSESHNLCVPVLCRWLSCACATCRILSHPLTWL